MGTNVGGQELIRLLAHLADIPEPELRVEIAKILESSGFNSDQLTLEQLRAALFRYLKKLDQENLQNDRDNILSLNTETVTLNH